MLIYNSLVPHFENPMRIIKLSKKTDRYIRWFEFLCFVDESHDNIKTQLPDLQYLILPKSFLADLYVRVKYFFRNYILYLTNLRNQFFKKVHKNPPIQNFVSISSNFKILEKLFPFI